MPYWQLTELRTDDDYESLARRGFTQHLCSLPAIDCKACGHAWAGQRILPIVGSKALRDLLSATHSPLSSRKFAALVTAVNERAPEAGRYRLFPGDRFRPQFIAVDPARINDVFFHSGRPVVSQKVKKSLIDARVRGLQFWPVVISCLTKKSEALRFDDYAQCMDQALHDYGGTAPLKSPEFFELSATVEIPLPLAFIKSKECPECGYEKITVKTGATWAFPDSDSEVFETERINSFIMGDRVMELLKSRLSPWLAFERV